MRVDAGEERHVGAGDYAGGTGLSRGFSTTFSTSSPYHSPITMPILFESDRRTLLAELLREGNIGRQVAALIGSTIVFGAIYGCVLGSWHGSRLAIYAAIKIPLLMLSTAAVTALFNWIVAALLGLPLRLPQTFALSLIPLAVAAIVVASLAPVAWLFTSSLPVPSPTQRTVHNLLYLVHTVLLAAGGVTGTSVLRHALMTVCAGDVARARRIRAAWIAAYAFVGGEIAWVLRPFVGSVYLPVVFLRSDALQGNVYEFILTDILPHLWRSL
jgi:hypothetical protein